MRRLAIIDLKTGRQPIYNEDKTVVVVYNGEIYNFFELRDELKKQGHRFVTESDTEVIVHGYEEWGVDVLHRLNGMFAIALYDLKQERLLLARDRVGKKPLYYSLQNNTLYFASELKALTVHPCFKREVSPEALEQYLAYDYIPSPGSIWKQVFKLQPAEYLIFHQGLVKKEIYWHPALTIQDISFPEAKGELDRLLADAVGRRLVADVPLGIFLSGSVDSSTIAYYAALRSQSKIKTFTIGFDEPTFDESPFARVVATTLATDHTTMEVRQEDMLEIIADIPSIADEPLADPSLIPTYFLSQLTREHVTVALGGDGADELLYGYQTFIAYTLQTKFGFLLPAVNRLAAVAAEISRLRPQDAYFSFDHNIQKYVDGLRLPLPLENQNWLASFTEREVGEVMGRQKSSSLSRDTLYQSTIALTRGKQFASGWQLLSYLYLKQYLAGQVLVKVDRASMAVSLEVRAPFLDYRVVEFLLTLPDVYKIRLGWNLPYFVEQKYILRSLMKRRLPQVAFRPKHGFTIPLARWLRKELKALTLDLLSPDALRAEGIFNSAFVDRLLKEHFALRANHAKKIWNLMVWELWRRKWLTSA